MLQMEEIEEFKMKLDLFFMKIFILLHAGVMGDSQAFER
jgi:hypothetical protein